MNLLTSQEIYALAADLAWKIKSHLEESWYDKSEISLSIGWSTKPELDPQALVSPSLEAPGATQNCHNLQPR